MLNLYDWWLKDSFFRFIAIPQILNNTSTDNDVAFSVADLFTAQVSFIFLSRIVGYVPRVTIIKISNFFPRLQRKKNGRIFSCFFFCFFFQGLKC